MFGEITARLYGNAAPRTVFGPWYFQAIATSTAPNLSLVDSNAQMDWFNPTAAVDHKRWNVFGADTWVLRTLNDAGTIGRNALVCTRGSGQSITNISFGNATDNPTYTFNGTGGLAVGAAPITASGSQLQFGTGNGGILGFSSGATWVDSIGGGVEFQRWSGTASLYLGYRMGLDGGDLAFYSAAAAAIGSQTWTKTLTATAAGLLKVPSSPLAAATTQVYTGLAAYKPSDTTAANNTLTADSTLSLTFNETGKYTFEAFLAFYEATSGTGGFQFDLGAGTATVAAILSAVQGFGTAVYNSTALTTNTGVSAIPTVTISSTAPSWFLAKGWLNISVAGTLTIRWAQNTTLGANPTTLKAGSYFMATKIGS